MTDSPNHTQPHVIAATAPSSGTNSCLPEIPIEIVSEEEMSIIEAAMAATLSSLSSSSIPSICSSSRSSLFIGNVRSISSITALSKRRLSSSSPSSKLPGGGCCEPDIEDSSDFRGTQKRNRTAESFLRRFRNRRYRRCFSVTDLTATEWCEKQMEYVLTFGRRPTSKAMKAGTARHAILEDEVVKKVEVTVHSLEDLWALKLLNFITGASQLLSEGLTRELPLIGFAEGVPIVGQIDEIRMPVGEAKRNPILIETKTRVRATLPPDPQRRNARLQLMCYKFLLDNSVANRFSLKQFLNSFSLDPYHILSLDIRESTSNAGVPAKNLDDIMRYYRNTCSKLLPADNQMFLRYELQKDSSVIGEDEFTYDHDWLKSQIQSCLEFWKGEREASYTPEEERWKCRPCQFSSLCPINANSDTSSHAENNSSPS